MSNKSIDIILSASDRALPVVQRTMAGVRREVDRTNASMRKGRALSGADVIARETAGIQQKLAADARRVFLATRTPQEQYLARMQRMSALLRAGRIDHDTYGRAIEQSRQRLIGATKGAQDLSRGLASIRGPGAAAFVGIGNAATAAAAGVSNLARQTAMMTGAATGLGAVGVIGTGIKMAADYEAATLSMGAMLGGTEKAEAKLKELREFAKTTPFTFPELVETTGQLIAYGVSADQVLPTLRMLGDVAAGSRQPLRDIAYLWGSARAQPAVYTKDINQMANRAIPVLEVMAQQLGTTTGGIREMAEDGKLTFGMMDNALRAMTQRGGIYFNQTKVAAQSLRGIFSNMSDAVGFALTDIGERLISATNLHGVIQQAIPAVDRFAGRVGNATSAVVAFAQDNRRGLLELGKWSTYGIGATLAVTQFGPALLGVNRAIQAMGTMSLWSGGKASLLGMGLRGISAGALSLGQTIRGLVSPVGLLTVGLTTLAAAFVKSRMSGLSFDSSLYEMLSFGGMIQFPDEAERFAKLIREKMGVAAGTMDDLKKRLNDTTNADERIRLETRLADLARERLMLAEALHERQSKFQQAFSGDVDRMTREELGALANVSSAFNRRVEQSVMQKVSGGQGEGDNSAFEAGRGFGSEMWRGLKASLSDGFGVGKDGLKKGLGFVAQNVGAYVTEMDRLRQAANSAFETTRTPMERAESEMATLAKAFQLGMLDKDTMRRRFAGLTAGLEEEITPFRPAGLLESRFLSGVQQMSVERQVMSDGKLRLAELRRQTAKFDQLLEKLENGIPVKLNGMTISTIF